MCREMAERAVNTRSISVWRACQAFRVSQACYRYASAMNDQNHEIADWHPACASLILIIAPTPFAGDYDTSKADISIWFRPDILTLR